MEEPKPGEKYQHFKGEDKIYEIVTVSRDCDNPNEKYVNYRSLYNTEDNTEEFPKGTVWSRSLEDFVGFKEMSGKKIKRFTKIGE